MRMPRRVRRTRRADVHARATLTGITPLMAATEIGTSCRFWARFWAVTTTSSSSTCARAAGAVKPTAAPSRRVVIARDFFIVGFLFLIRLFMNRLPVEGLFVHATRHYRYRWKI